MNTQLRVLLAEDDESTAMLVRAQLAQAVQPFEVRWVTSLQGTLEVLHANQADAVLLDLGLDDSTGLETFRSVRPFGHRVPILVLSAVDDERAIAAAMREGAQDWLVKGRTGPMRLEYALRCAVERVHFRAALDNAARMTPAAVALTDCKPPTLLVDANGQLRWANSAARAAGFDPATSPLLDLGNLNVLFSTETRWMGSDASLLFLALSLS